MNSKANNSPSGAGGVGGAIIFSAGLGTRFKPWTNKHPKALALVNGKTLLQRNIEYLQQYGITDVVVNVHHFADQIIEAVEINKGWGSNIIISDETEEVLETGGGLLKAKEHFNTDELLVSINVDILTDLDLNKLIAFHQQHKPLISFGITGRKSSRYFLFDEHNRLIGWKNSATGEVRMALPSPSEKARPDDSFGRVRFQKAYSCVVVFDPKIFSLMPFTGKFSLTDLYLTLAADHPILGYDHSGDKWVDVGKPESVAIAEALFT